MTMVRNRKAVWMLLVGALFASTFASAAAPETKADHIALAEKYDKLAQEQQAIAQEHEQMYREYNANAHRYPKQVREKWIREMRKHCQTIARAAKQLAAEYRAMARWHRTAAEHVNE